MLIIFDERYSIENKLCEFYYVVTQLPSALKYAKFQPNRRDTYEDAVEKNLLIRLDHSVYNKIVTSINVVDEQLIADLIDSPLGSVNK